MDKLLTNKPLYNHDCSKCVFLGTTEEKDFYFCKNEITKADSLVVRLSNKPSDYLSMPVNIAEGGFMSGEIKDSSFELGYHLYRIYKLLNN